MPDGLLFLLAAGSAAQNVGFLALRNGYLFHFHVRLHPRPVILQQLLFKVLHLAAWRADQILTPAFADGRQVLFADNARSNTQIRRALPYLRSTMRRMVSMVETSARLPLNVS